MHRHLIVALALSLLLCGCRQSGPKAFPPEPPGPPAKIAAPVPSNQVEAPKTPPTPSKSGVVIDNSDPNISIIKIYKIWQEGNYVYVGAKIKNISPKTVDACLMGAELPDCTHCVWVIRASTALKSGQTKVIHVHFYDDLHLGPQRCFYIIQSHRKGEDWPAEEWPE